MKNFKSIAFLLFFFIAATGTAQNVYHFKKGLFLASGGRYGREAIYTDPLAYQLYTNTLQKPVDGGTFGENEKGETLKWQAITADSANRLFLRSAGRNRGFGRSGYIYLTYDSDKERMALLNIRGTNNFFLNGVPHAGDPYGSEWLKIPVQLKKGLNELYVRGAFITASLEFPAKPVLLNTQDPTLPSIVLSNSNNGLLGAVVIINTSAKELNGLEIKTSLDGKEAASFIPSIPPLSIRKVPFRIDGSTIKAKGKYECSLSVMEKNKVLDKAIVTIEAVTPAEPYSSTFISAIDGSLQYYAVTPQAGGFKNNTALFFSVHGAGVEAIGQARAYASKDWGTLVAPTNRRPRGFNWEDWGRLDALEVLKIAKEKFRPDPHQIYLTGHSMGGHGTWFLGAAYPDQWAAIAPCAGYPTLKGYGSADGLIPDSSSSPAEQMLLRASNQSDVPRLATNYKPLGVYIFHGDADRTVSVNYARQMRKQLADFHADLSYYEYPGGSHWFGNQSVDWQPIFDFFSWHKRADDTAVNKIDFTTANPGISPAYRWASVYQQIHPLQYSRLQLERDIHEKTIKGTTENVRLLTLSLKDFTVGDTVRLSLDGSSLVHLMGGNDSLFLLKNEDQWTVSSKPDPAQKGPHRYGTLKDAFNNRMVFVYGTSGTPEENEWSLNKAKFDAETWYYRGNGAVDIIADTKFSLEKYKDRGVIIYGNKNTNLAWKTVLNNCPIQVERNKISAGDKVWKGDDLSACFVWPLQNSPVASVAVIGGSGIRGMKAANANQYFAGASGFPDFMIYSLDMLRNGSGQIKLAGFYDNEWKLSPSDLIQSE